MLVRGSVSVRIVWPVVNWADAVALLPVLFTATFQFQLAPVLVNTIVPSAVVFVMLLVLTAVRSGHRVVTFTMTLSPAGDVRTVSTLSTSAAARPCPHSVMVHVAVGAPASRL